MDFVSLVCKTHEGNEKKMAASPYHKYTSIRFNMQYEGIWPNKIVYAVKP